MRVGITQDGRLSQKEYKMRTENCEQTAVKIIFQSNLDELPRYAEAHSLASRLAVYDCVQNSIDLIHFLILNRKRSTVSILIYYMPPGEQCKKKFKKAVIYDAIRRKRLFLLKLIQVFQK